MVKKCLYLSFFFSQKRKASSIRLHNLLYYTKAVHCVNCVGPEYIHTDHYSLDCLTNSKGDTEIAEKSGN